MSSQQVHLSTNVKGYYYGTKTAIEGLAGVPTGSIAFGYTTTPADGEFGFYNGTAWTWGTGGTGVTGGNAHDHSGGDGAQIAHGSLSGLTTADDHPHYLRAFTKIAVPTVDDDEDLGYDEGDIWITPSTNRIWIAEGVADGNASWLELVMHSMASAANDFIVGSAAGQFVVKTLSETITILRTSLDSIFAPIAKGVTNGDTHNHVGGDGAALSYAEKIGMFTNSTVPASTTHYGAPYKAGLDANNVNFPVLEAETYSHLTVRKASGTAQPASGTLVITLYLNNVASALTVNFANADGAGGVTKQDTSNTVAVSAGDQIRWVVQNNATATSCTIIGIEMKATKQTT